MPWKERSVTYVSGTDTISARLYLSDFPGCGLAPSLVVRTLPDPE